MARYYYLKGPGAQTVGLWEPRTLPNGICLGPETVGSWTLKASRIVKRIPGLQVVLCLTDRVRKPLRRCRARLGESPPEP